MMKKFFGLLLKKNGDVLEQLYPARRPHQRGDAELKAICNYFASDLTTRSSKSIGVPANGLPHTEARPAFGSLPASVFSMCVMTHLSGSGVPCFQALPS